MAKSYKVGCKTSGDTNWAYNGLRFPSRESAESYALDLSMRWTALAEYEIHESDDEVNRD